MHGVHPSLNDGLKDALLIQSDSEGNVVNELLVDYNAFDMVQAFDTIGSDYVTAEIYGNGWYPPALIRRINSTGDTIRWQRYLNTINWFDGYLLMKTMHNGNIAVMWTEEINEPFTQDYRKYVTCLDGQTGEELWPRVHFYEPFTKIPTTLKIADNGDIIGAGTATDVTINSGVSAGWLFRISPDGELLWEHVYYDFASESALYADKYSFSDMAISPDGGIVATGSVDLYKGSTIGYETDTWILKVDGNGCLQPGCNTYEIPVGSDMTLGLEEPKDDIPTKIIFSPNPATTQSTLHYQLSNKPTEVKLYDLFGREQLEITLPAGQQQQTIHLSTLPSGMYVYQITQNREVVGSGKLVKR